MKELERADADTHLQNNLNRWYDATIGRCLSVDPIGFAAGDANLYRYVGNATMFAVDPWGLWTKKSENLYCADRDGETLQELAELHWDSRDWVCIWPVGDMSKWEGYPTAKACACADVSNLTAKPDTTLVMMPQRRGSDEFLSAVNAVFQTAMPWIYRQREDGVMLRERQAVPNWGSGIGAVYIFMDAAAQKGRTPIGLLAIGGHLTPWESWITWVYRP